MKQTQDIKVIEKDNLTVEETINNVLVQLIATVDSEVMTDSLTVSKVFGKEHRVILRAIRNLPDFAERINRSKIVPVDYTDEKGRKQVLLEINQETFTILVLGLTGKTVYPFKVAFVNLFNNMLRKQKQQFIEDTNLRCSLEVEKAKEMAETSNGFMSLRKYLKINNLTDKFNENEAWDILESRGLIYTTYPKVQKRVLNDTTFGDQKTSKSTIMFNPEKLKEVIN